MTATARTRNGRNGDLKELRQAPRQCERLEALDKSDIAELSPTAIDNMNCDELVRLILASELHGQPCFDFRQHLPFYDRETLKRLAFLAHRCCRNQGY